MRVALGRVLTLIISTALGHEEEAINARERGVPRAPDARDHRLEERGRHEVPGRLDAQIRVGATRARARSSSSAPTARRPPTRRAWSRPPAAGCARGRVVARRRTVAAVRVRPGRIAQRRITDAAAQKDPNEAIAALGESYVPGDTDFAWTRLTLWRNQLAAALDQPPYEPVTAVEVSGAFDSPSTILLAAWLQLQLEVPVSVVTSPRATGSSGIHGVKLVSARAGRSSSSAPWSTSRRCPCPGSPRTTSRCRAATCATAWPRNSVDSTRTSSSETSSSTGCPSCASPSRAEPPTRPVRPHPRADRSDRRRSARRAADLEHGSHVTNERRGLLVHPDKQALGASVAARFITKIIDVLDEQERADIAISGGSVSTLVLAAIGQSQARESVDWSKVHVWWVDERWVPGVTQTAKRHRHEGRLLRPRRHPRGEHPPDRDVGRRALDRRRRAPVRA